MLGLAPLTGIPLPFISYGGANLLLTLASVGILLNIARCMADDNQQLRCLIAAGGTAGHVVPSLAVAEALRARGVEVTFAGSPDRVEARLVPDAGFQFDASRGLRPSTPASMGSPCARAVGGGAPRACRRF